MVFHALNHHIKSLQRNILFASTLLRPATCNYGPRYCLLFRIAAAKFQAAKFRALPCSGGGNGSLPQLRPLPPLFITLATPVAFGTGLGSHPWFTLSCWTSSRSCRLSKNSCGWWCWSCLGRVEDFQSLGLGLHRLPIHHYVQNWRQILEHSRSCHHH